MDALPGMLGGSWLTYLCYSDCPGVLLLWTAFSDWSHLSYLFTVYHAYCRGWIKIWIWKLLYQVIYRNQPFFLPVFSSLTWLLRLVSRVSVSLKLSVFSCAHVIRTDALKVNHGQILFAAITLDIVLFIQQHYWTPSLCKSLNSLPKETWNCIRCSC